MKYRNIIKMFLLAAVTLGVYYIYWFYDTSRELRQKGAKIPRLYWLLVLPGSSLALALNGLLYWAATSPAIQRMCEILSYIFLVGLLAGFPMMLWWLWRYCQAIDIGSKGTLRPGLAFGLIFLFFPFGLSPLWPLIVQDYYNRANKATSKLIKKGYMNKPGPFRA